MSLLTVHLSLVSPYGSNEVPAVASGRVVFEPVAHGKYNGAFRAIEVISSSIVQGIMTPLELTPGAWYVTVEPAKGNPWPKTIIELEEGMPEPVNLADLTPDIVVNAKEYAKGDSAYQTAVNNGFVGSEEEWLSTLVGDIVWSKDAQAKVQGFWIELSSVEPSSPTLELSDGSSVPIIWQKPADIFVPVVPEEPTWDLYNGSILVPSMVGLDYVIVSVDKDDIVSGTDVIIPPGTPYVVDLATRPFTVTVEAVARPGYQLPNSFIWNCSFPDPNDITIMTSESFTGADTADISSRNTDIYAGGSSKLWVLEGEKERFSIENNQLVASSGPVGWTVAPWGAAWMDTGAYNQRLEFDLTIPSVTSPDTILSITMSRFSAFNGYTFYIYKSKISIRPSGNGQGYTVFTNNPTLSGRYVLERYKDTVSITSPNTPKTTLSVVSPPEEQIGTYIGFRPSDVNESDYPGLNVKIDNIVVSKIGF